MKTQIHNLHLNRQEYGLDEWQRKFIRDMIAKIDFPKSQKQIEVVEKMWDKYHV